VHFKNEYFLKIRVKNTREKYAKNLQNGKIEKKHPKKRRRKLNKKLAWILQ